MANVACGNCGTALDEPLGLRPEERKPCPVCGSRTSRSFSCKVIERAELKDSMEVEVTAYPRALLSVARSFIDQGHFSIAVVVAHMACEVATERRLAEAFVAKGVQYLEDPVTDLFNGYSLGNDKIRNVYIALHPYPISAGSLNVLELPFATE